MTSQQLSIASVRRICLHAQGFGSTRCGAETKVGPGRLRAQMNRMNLLQLDSIPIIVRTQYLPLFSRLGHYQQSDLDKIAYKKDQWIETWSHEACLIPVEREPLLRWSMDRARDGGLSKSMQTFAKEHSAYIRKIHREVRSKGRMRAADLTDRRPTAKSGVWGRGSMGAVALNWLFRTGELGIRRVGNFEKEFDLIERIVPEKILNEPTPSQPEAIASLMLLAARAYGVATEADLTDYFRLPLREARDALAQLVNDGRLEQVQVRGWNKPAYQCPGEPVTSSVKGAALVSPFDPLVWNRDRIERLFDFEYRIEIYVPQRKRRWGYYVLPFLLDEKLVARVDLKNDRQTRTLRVPGAFMEPGCNPTRVAQALAAELYRLATFVGCDRVVVGRRGDLASALRSAVKSHR